MLSRLLPDDVGETEINLLYDSFKLECIESGNDAKTIPGYIVFIEHLKALFPNTERVRKKVWSGS